MRSNLNVDIKFYADKVLEMLGDSLSKYTDKIGGTKSGSSGGGRGQGSRGSGDGYGSGAQRRGGRRGGR
jgi:hydrogenase maturation factor HypE